MRIITVVVFLVAFFISNAHSEEKFDFLKSNPRFAQIYLGCTDKKASDCERDVSKKYCKWFEGLPADVKAKLTREMACDYIAQEVRGDSSQDDKAKLDSIRDLNCMGSAGETLMLLREHWSQSEAMRALLFFNLEFGKDMDECLKKLPPSPSKEQ